MLETLLCTAGIPYEFIDSLAGVRSKRDLRSAYLVVDPADHPALERLASETALVALPSPRPDPLLTGKGESSVRDPQQFRIISEPTRGGHLIGIAADLVGAAFALLTRAEEYVVATRDDHDRFLWSHSLLQPPELAARPLVSEYTHLLLACIKEASLRAGIPVIRKEFWPRGKGMAACLTHDVDMVRRGKLPRGVAVRDVRGLLSSMARGQFGRAMARAATIARTAAADRNPYWSFDRISALEREHGYRSTYYFMVGNHHPEDGSYDVGSPSMVGLLQDLVRSDCEIGLHGSYASYRRADLLLALKSRLEERLDKPVTGHRNHLLRFRVPDSWRALEAAGFSYDATLGFPDHEGFRGSQAFPFRPYDLTSARAFDLLEIPLALMDMTLHKYRRLRGETAEAAVRSVLEQTRAVNGLATLLWHNDAFYDPEYPGLGRLYELALDWLSENDAHVATVQEIDSWWRARSSMALSPLVDGRTGWRMESPLEIEGLVLRVSLPDPRSSLRVRGQAPLALRRDGPDYLLEFDRLPAGFCMDLEYT